MQDADAFCYICVRSSYHFPIQLTIHQNGINTLHWEQIKLFFLENPAFWPKFAIFDLSKYLYLKV